MHRGPAETSQTTTIESESLSSSPKPPAAQHGLDATLRNDSAVADIDHHDDEQAESAQHGRNIHPSIVSPPPRTDDGLAFPRSTKPGDNGRYARSRSGNRLGEPISVDMQEVDEKLRRLNERAADTRTRHVRPSNKKPLLSGANESASVSALSAVDSSLPVAGQRISEYEQAMTPVSPRHGQSSLKSKGIVGSPSKGRQLSDFPNEILTHIFSHLRPGTHSAVALVSKRFYSLITTPHVWRMAFFRQFPGQAVAETQDAAASAIAPSIGVARSEKRLFSRLTQLASWRSEYLLRTQLLRNLESGRPGPAASGTSSGGNAGNGKDSARLSPLSGRKATAVITYNTSLPWVVSHVHATFTASAKKAPLVIHGAAAVGRVTVSNPTIGRLESWAKRDLFSLPLLNERNPQLTLYGMGSGPAAGPNVMDVSHQYGAVIGEGYPGGGVLARTFGSEALTNMDDFAEGRRMSEGERAWGVVPIIPVDVGAVCAVWIAKSSAVPSLTQSMVGMLAGTSLGIVSAYAFGKATDPTSRYSRCQITARWALCPGVPIVSIRADDSFSEKRKAAGRLWAVALNALGEVYYLQDVPTVVSPSVVASEMASSMTATGVQAGAVDSISQEMLVWQAGTTARWELVEPTSRRAAATAEGGGLARPGVKISESLVLAASPSPPRSSQVAAKLSHEQRTAEAQAITRFFHILPADFRAVYGTGWDMRQTLEVDFGGGSNNSGGGEGGSEYAEGIFVVSPGGTHQAKPIKITRFIRLIASAGTRTNDGPLSTGLQFPASPIDKIITVTPGLTFGIGSNVASDEEGEWRMPRARERPVTTGWQTTDFSINSLQNPNQVKTESTIDANGLGQSNPEADKDGKEGNDLEITCVGVDQSYFALLNPSEDSLLQMESNAKNGPPLLGSNVPGRRARWMAIGTNAGTVVVWNMREAVLRLDLGGVCSSNGNNSSADRGLKAVLPLRVIQTTSPEVSSVAVSSLYLVHGGTDGLAQAWDPLASSMEPIRTLNARTAGRLPDHSTRVASVPRARFAAVGAFFLDPDPAVLRGVLAVGTLVRYWSFSSSHGGRTSRRRQRRQRFSNVEGHMASRRLDVQTAGYIAAETAALRREQEDESRERAHLLRRFGVGGPGGLTDDEALRYAELLSQEAYLDEQQRPSGGGSGNTSGGNSSSVDLTSLSEEANSTEEGSFLVATEAAEAWATTPAVEPIPESSAMTRNEGRGGGEDDDFELQMQRAIRLSLMEGVNDGDAMHAGDPETAMPPGQQDRQTANHASPPVSEFASPKMSLSSSPEAGQSRNVYRMASVGSQSSHNLYDYSTTGHSQEDDLQLALRLSLQEQSQIQIQSQSHNLQQIDEDAALAALLSQEEFPALEARGKGKGKGV